MGLEFVLGLLLNSKGMAMQALLPLAWMALRSRRPIFNSMAILLPALALYGGMVAPGRPRSTWWPTASEAWWPGRPSSGLLTMEFKPSRAFRSSRGR